MKLAILDDYQNAALDAADWNSLGPAVEVTTFNRHLGHDQDAIAAKLQPYSILIAMRERTPFPRSLIERLRNLKYLVTTGMRNLEIDMDAAREKGITVSGTQMLGYPAAEHALALILDLFKKISRESAVMRKGGWQGFVSEGMNGKTLGVLGLGKLGSRVARAGKALDMNVIAWSENLTAERCAEEGVRHVDKETLFRESDVISIHLVLSERTRGLVGPQELALMKPTAYLVNTSRGPIVEEAALLQALETCAIAGAGLDVFDVEPLPADNPLRSLENAVLTGHTGFVVKELYEKAYGDAVENVAAWLKGEPIRVLNGVG